MSNEEELKGEIARLKQEIERLKTENKSSNQGMIKKSAEVAGERSGEGVLGKEVKKIDLSKGFDKEEVRLTKYFSLRGHRLEKDQVCRCSFCNIVLTDFEKIEVNNRVYCEKCYRKEEHDLDKEDYKVLVCFSRGFTETSTIVEFLGFGVTIQRLTGLTKREADKKIEKLLDHGYLFIHGLILREIRVSSKGEEALTAYDQIYRDGDCNDVRNRVWIRRL